MSKIEVTFACGCSTTLDEADSGSAEPHCAEHNCYVVARVKTPPPRFRGSPGVTGPLVEEAK